LPQLTRLMRTAAALPVLAARTGIRAAATVTAATAAAAATAVSRGSVLAVAPLRGAGSVSPARVVDAVSDVVSVSLGGGARRRCWRGADRCWIEVRGLGDTDSGSAVAAAVLDAVRTHPGVVSADLNRPLARVVVRLGAGAPTTGELCGLVGDAEHTAGRPKPKPACELPGDGVVLAAAVTAAALGAAGLSVAVAGRALGWPRLPTGLAAPVTVVDYQPRLRRLVETRLGTTAADTLLAVATTTAYTVTLAPASLAVDVLVQLTKVVEAQAALRSWQRHEPALAEHAACPETADPPQRPRPVPPGPIERYADRSGLVQAIGATVVGFLTRDPNAAATAALVAAPKAARTSRESFAGTLGRGLADKHGVLPLQPQAFRRMDRVDAVVIDPRALYTGELRIGRIRGVADTDRATVWSRAQAELERATLNLGWQPVGAGEVLVRREHHPLAAAVVAEARRGHAEVVSIDVDALGDLRSGFDDLHPAGPDIDEALAAAVVRLQDDGRTVAVVSPGAAGALAAADVSIGVICPDGPPPWHAQLLVDDLCGVWHLMHALPAARRASRRGVEIATGASVLGALLMVPGVRGRGPGPVTAGAAAGVWTGYRLARGALRAQPPPPAATQEWHAMSVEQVRRLLPPPPAQTDPARRSRVSSTARASAGAMGSIAGPARRAVGEFAGAMRGELSDPLTPVLAIGSAASAVLGSPVDAALVASVLAGNAALAATQRVRSERLLRRMLAVQDPPARRVAGAAAGARCYDSVAAGGLRPGDVIEVRSGEVVPADARLTEAADLEVDESSLTGESLPVAKQVAATPAAPLAERSCMLHAGSTVVAGTAVAIVTAVGAATAARRATAMPRVEQAAVGLQAQLRDLTDKAWPLSLAGGALVTGLGLLRLTGLRQAVSSGVAVSVAAVPEGLPLVATLAQQASARRLTRSGALVRSPRSVEALGRVDVVCFDKTGTLSENRLRVSDIVAAQGVSREEVLAAAARATPPANGDRHEHATDVAVVAAAAPAEHADGDTAYLPFRSGRPFSASVSGIQLAIKGAPEAVLAACATRDREIAGAVEEMAARGLRVIAVAGRRLSAQQAESVRDDADAFARLCGAELEVLGLLGLSDTPRAAAGDLLDALRGHGVGVRLITGDHPVTATAIAAELGMPVSGGEVITGAEWAAMPRRAQEHAVTERLVFARMLPEHKVQIVETLERLGHVCAMVGDGANDAAAIRAATVGIGVAAAGGDPARTAADVMLLDGRIEALLDALDEGRQLWRRVQAAVAVLLGGNAGEVAFAIAGTAVTGRSPLNARQLLLVNMFTDALPAAALAVSAPSNAARFAARGPDRAALWRMVAVRGTATAGAATAAWVLASFTGRPRRASTVALVALVSAQLGQTVLDSHSPLVVATAAGSLGALAVVISTPGLSHLLGSTPLGPVGWGQALGAAAVATAAAAVVPRLLTSTARLAVDDQSTISTTPTRHSTAYSSRNGAVSSPTRVSVNGSGAIPTAVEDTPPRSTIQASKRRTRHDGKVTNGRRIAPHNKSQNSSPTGP
jgi:cation-transporting ATPase I